MLSRVTVINLSREPQTLEDGTMIGAAGTPEAKRENVTLSDGDRRRLVDRDQPILSVVEPKPVEPARPTTATKGESK